MGISSVKQQVCDFHQEQSKNKNNDNLEQSAKQLWSHFTA